MSPNKHASDWAPFSPQTANQIIVTPDLTLEYFLNRLKHHPIHKDLVHQTEQKARERNQRIDILIAVPANRKFYGFVPELH